MDPKEIKTEDALAFKQEDGTYVFPFDVFDQTPGGSNLGRIEWRIELHRSPKKVGGRWMIVEMWVSALQTRDERYRGKTFKIGTYTEAITPSKEIFPDKDSFVPWRVFFCDVHAGAVIMDAYPKDRNKELVIRADSSISNDIYFR